MTHSLKKRYTTRLGVLATSTALVLAACSGTTPADGDGEGNVPSNTGTPDAAMELTDAKKLEIALTPLTADDETPLVVDVVFNGDLIKRAHLTQHATSTPATQLSFDLPARVGRLEVWLPHASGVVLNQIELTGATVCRSVDPRPRWVTYGSSITHCIEADGPSQTRSEERRVGKEGGGGWWSKR